MEERVKTIGKRELTHLVLTSQELTSLELTYKIGIDCNSTFLGFHNN